MYLTGMLKVEVY